MQKMTELRELLQIKLIIGLDFAVTLSSPDSSGVLFDITSEQSVGLKWLTLNKHKKMFPFVTCEISFGQNVGKLVFGIDVPDLAFTIRTTASWQ